MILRDEVIERMEGLYSESKMKSFLDLSFEIMMEFGDEGFEADEILAFLEFKMRQNLENIHPT